MPSYDVLRLHSTNLRLSAEIIGSQGRTLSTDDREQRAVVARIAEHCTPTECKLSKQTRLLTKDVVVIGRGNVGHLDGDPALAKREVACKQRSI